MTNKYQKLTNSILQDVCTNDLQIRISISEYDYIIKEFQRSENRERNKKKQRSRQKSLKDKNDSIPGFVSEEITRRILSEVFKVQNCNEIYI